MKATHIEQIYGWKIKNLNQDFRQNGKRLIYYILTPPYQTLDRVISGSNG